MNFHQPLDLFYRELNMLQVLTYLGMLSLYYQQQEALMEERRARSRQSAGGPPPLPNMRVS